MTAAEYGRFLDDKPDPDEDFRENAEIVRRTPSPDCAIHVVTWYKAAQYCNWLSAKERLPEDQWFHPKQIGPGMELPADHLKRTGYRLPTEAEWEYACRAGSASVRPFGSSEEWLPEYAWFEANAEHKTHPTGRKEPSDTGLFDIMGNASEWCGDPYAESYIRVRDSGPVLDEMLDTNYSDGFERVQRGGSFASSALGLRPAFRSGKRLPTTCSVGVGFHPARTNP